MKIDPSDKSQLSIPSSATKPQKVDPNSSFAHVLDKTVQDTRTDRTASNQPVQPAVKPPLVTECNQTTDAGMAVQQGLGVLERYQQLLIDPQASLRSMQPMMQQMKKEAAELEPVMEAMPEGHPIKQVLKETLILISKEIARYNLGQYV